MEQVGNLCDVLLSYLLRQTLQNPFMQQRLFRGYPLLWVPLQAPLYQIRKTFILTPHQLPKLH